MTKKLNKDVLEFVKKIEPYFAELIQQKITESRKNGDVMDINQLTSDVTSKMKEWLNLREGQLDTQLEIEVLLSLSANLMLLWWSLDNTIKKMPVITTSDAIGG